MNANIDETLRTFDYIADYSNIENSYKKVLRRLRNSNRDSRSFSKDLELNIKKLKHELETKTYKVSGYNEFIIHEPKQRIVNAPKFRDKIVQLLLHDILEYYYEPVYINTSYSCRKNKGTHRAVNKVQNNMISQINSTGEGWIVKLDVRKFFYSIDREILKTIIRKRIKDPDILYIIDVIIDSSPEGDVGIPLGNITSQDFANIYLNELDQYCKRWLGIKRYVRYADDVICVVGSKEEAQELLDNMIYFLKTRLNLDVNNKTKIFPIEQGVNAYGYKIWTTHRKIRDDSKKRMKRKIKALDLKYQLGIMELEEIQQIVNSWLGHARHSNSYNLCKNIFNKYDYIKIEGVDYFGKVSRNS